VNPFYFFLNVMMVKPYSIHFSAANNLQAFLQSLQKLPEWYYKKYSIWHFKPNRRLQYTYHYTLFCALLAQNTGTYTCSDTYMVYI
jgi:hypothetical protein